MTILQKPLTIALIIPTYNNATTIEAVVREARQFVRDIFIVNDGSTDETQTIITGLSREFDGVRVLCTAQNSGKGVSLKKGFETAYAQGFTNAITMDACGKHAPGDLAVFVEKIYLAPDRLWIGHRTMFEGRVQKPLRAGIGQAFGALWLKFLTENHVHDAQCGFRAYPLAPLLKLKCKGRRFEYEHEALIYAHWNGIAVESVPIHRGNDPRKPAISRCRSVMDRLRIGKVTAQAACIKILLPWKTAKVPGKTWREKLIFIFKRELYGHSPRKSALSLSLGVCIGIMPLYGLQSVLILALTPLLRLNLPLAFLGSCISFPPMIPVLIAAGIAVGKVLVPNAAVGGVLFSGNAFAKSGVEWVVGSVVLAIAAGIVTYVAMYPVLAVLNRQKSAISKKITGKGLL